jgi:hypothetical protein
VRRSFETFETPNEDVRRRFTENVAHRCGVSSET